LKRIAELQELGTFAFVTPDFEGVGFDAEQCGGLLIVKQFVGIVHVQVPCQKYRRVTQSRDGVSSFGVEPEPVGYVALCCSR
jgi:hypothetical protein